MTEAPLNGQIKHFLESFEKITGTYPDNAAVIVDGQTVLSYSELKAKALNVAAALQAENVGKEDLVGLHIEKSSDYLVALLGCWYAGAAFMPIDPDLPDERLAYVLDNSKVKIVLSRPDIAQNVDGNDRTVLSIDDAIDSDAPYTQLDTQQTTDLAYVIYTSGSTGTPKGVEVTHSGLVPMLDAQIDAFKLDETSRSLFYLSTNFDASVSDIGTAFLSGAALCIETKTAQEIAANLSQIITDRGISYMDIPPSMLRILDADNAPPSLKSVTIGGEALDPEVARQWASKVHLVNVYGPTEATVCSSLNVIDPENWSKPTIGTELPYVSYRVVDAENKNVEEGEFGELLIGGAQLARGYLGRPDLNEQKFIDIDGERFYRSGDLIQLGPDNQLIFQGRIDRQVKIRGQLVELEEVEAKILENPDVAQAAVVKRSLNGRDALVAFIRSKIPDDTVSEDALKTTLESSLSPWMIPAHFEAVEQMPTTSSGKINLSALKEQALATVAGASHDDDLTETEEKVLGVWRETLKHDDIGLDVKFCDAGGDSLALVELSMAAEVAGLNMTPSLVQEKETIRAVAQYIDEGPDDEHDSVMFDSMNADDLRDAMALDKEWDQIISDARNLPEFDRDAAPKNILLTGSNGFLASRLVHELLNHSDDTVIYAMVRGRDEDHAMSRIEEALENHGLKLTPELKARVKPICGDIAQPLMGLTPDVYETLSTEIDTVMHSAAIVNMTASYDDLYGANVTGTKEAARFALTGKRKKFHYASTLSVFVSTDQNHGELLESDRLENTETVFGGYGQTKWAAEYFLHQIPDEVCDMSIHRLGLITGDTLTGRSSPKDFLHMFVNGIVSLGATPDAKAGHIEVDTTPIDYSCEVLRHIMLSPEHEQDEGHKVYHIANKAGFSLDQILNELRWRGLHIDSLSPNNWADKMARMRKAGFSTEESAAYFAISRMLPSDDVLSRHVTMDLFQATGVSFHQSNTEKVLEGSGIVLPLPDNRLLSTYIDSITGKNKSISTRGVTRSMKKKTGLILGKFIPFHRGHEYLIDFARQYPDVGKLYVVVDRIKDPSIPSATRVKWIQDTFPDVTVLPLGDYNYQDPSEAPSVAEFWKQWEDSLKDHIPEQVDYVFNSEAYGWKLAEVLGATHIPVDRGRDNFPISGTDVRKDPLAHWEYLPEVVRPYFLRKVAVVGAESTGKSTMAVNLAKAFNTAVVPEYARVFLESLAEQEDPRSTVYGDLEHFANGQKASEHSLTSIANRVLICDTEGLTTQVWSSTLYPEEQVHETVREHANDSDYDLYIVANPDVEWKPDTHRQWEDESKDSRRIAFNHRILAELNARGKPYIEIGGKDYDERFEQARDAIIQRVFKGRTFSDFKIS